MLENIKGVDEMQEVWRTVVTEEGVYKNYKISNLGRIKSIERKVWNGKGWRIVKERIMKLGNDGRGYSTINLCKNGKVKNYKLHKLLAYAFIPNVMGYNCIDHKDTNTQNNNLSNIVWVTHKQNMNNKLSKIKMSETHTGRVFSEEHKKNLSKAGKGRVFSEEHKKNLSKAHTCRRIICIETGEEFISMKEATKQFGINVGNISRVCNRKRKQAKNLTFRYLDQVLFYN